MKISRLRLPSPALIVACVALFAALGGTTYAATSAGATHAAPSAGAITLHFTNITRFNNKWRPARSKAYARPGYARYAGVVHLRGVIYDGRSGRTAFLLPTSVRPNHLLYLQVFTGRGKTGSVLIQHDGEVIPLGSSVRALTSLDGISFAAGE
jgi:hypothetical protein